MEGKEPLKGAHRGIQPGPQHDRAAERDTGLGVTGKGRGLLRLCALDLAAYAWEWAGGPGYLLLPRALVVVTLGAAEEGVSGGRWAGMTVCTEALPLCGMGRGQPTAL